MTVPTDKDKASTCALTYGNAGLADDPADRGLTTAYLNDIAINRRLTLAKSHKSIGRAFHCHHPKALISGVIAGFPVTMTGSPTFNESRVTPAANRPAAPTSMFQASSFCLCR